MFTTIALAAALTVGQATGTYDWKPIADEPNELACWSLATGCQCGSYDYARAIFRPYDAATRTWGAPTEPPVMPPHRPQVNFGVDVGRVNEYARASGNGSVYSHEGRIVSREQVLRLMAPAVGDGTLPNDGHLPRLTVISSDRGEQVRRDMDAAPVLAAFKGQVLFQGYLPNDVMVARVVPPAALAEGLPCLYLQHANGKVIWRGNSYPGPEGLATALRRIQPGTDPSRDPPMTPPVLGVAGVPPEFVYLAIVVALVGVVLYYARPQLKPRTTAIWSR